MQVTISYFLNSDMVTVFYNNLVKIKTALLPSAWKLLSRMVQPIDHVKVIIPRVNIQKMHAVHMY